MKLLFKILTFFIIFIIACKTEPKQAEKSISSNEVTVVVLSDTAAIAETIHNFYKYYNRLNTDTASAQLSDFVDDSGAHLKLNMVALKKYFGGFFSAGVVSDEFIENEYKFYTACEKAWQKEAKDDVPTGMDADKYYCGQDFEEAEFTTAPISATITGDRAKAKMLFKKGSANGESRDFELKKENAKWLITKVLCDMGVVY